MNRFPLTELESRLQKKFDAFICCGSFEPRCYSAADNLSRDMFKKALIVHNDKLEAEVGSNTGYLRKLFAGIEIPVPISMADPLSSADSLMKSISALKKESPVSVLFDITTFTHETLLIALRIVELVFDEKDHVEFVYTIASNYSPGEEKSGKWLSLGVEDVRSVLGFAGQMSQNKKTHLIILTGYESERTEMLISALEPNKISLGCGIEGTETYDGHYELNEHFVSIVLDTQSNFGDLEKFEFSCTDPLAVKDSIIRQAQKWSDYNTIVAPMNTKISTVGAALAGMLNKSFQLCYSQPILYNYKDYAKPGDACYLFSIPDFPGLLFE